MERTRDADDLAMVRKLFGELASHPEQERNIVGFVEDVVDGPQRLGPTSCPFLPPNVSRGMVPRCFHTCASGL